MKVAKTQDREAFGDHTGTNVRVKSIKDTGLERGYKYASYVPLQVCDGYAENFVPLPVEMGSSGRRETGS